MMASTLSSPRSWQLPAAAVFATMASALGLGRLIHPGMWVAMVLLVAVLLAGSGIGLRRLNVPRALIVLIQFVLVLCVLTALLVPGSAIGGVIPGSGALRALANRIGDGGSDLRQFSPPAPGTPGITALMAVSGAGFAFVIDVLAVTLRRPVLAGAPILAVYLIPATRQPGGLSWLAFAFAAAGYLALVGTDGHERLGQWGRTVQQRTGRPSLAGPTNTGLTRRISVWAIAAALFLPLLIPTYPHLLDLGGGNGGGGSGNGGTIYLNQTVNIAEDLSSPTATPMFSYRTTSTSPLREYFQQEVLTQFNGTEWDPPNSAATVSPGSVAIPGLDDPDVARQTVHVSVNVSGRFAFSEAPSPYATTDITGLNDEQIDANTLTVYINDGDNKSRNGAHYNTVSTQLTPTVSQLMNATSGQDPIGKNYLSLPNDVRGLLTSTAQRITAGDATPYQKAMALQDFFQSDFTYSLDPKITGNGTAAIDSFLQNKAGFCQQFAATMAAMARALDIPAVVVVGYTPGTVQSDGSFQVTTHDAHAWPMLYFDGIGWVQFEPTPKIVSDGRADAQPWTQTLTQPSGAASLGASPGVSATPSTQASSGNCASNQEGLHHIGVGGLAGNGCANNGSGAGAAPRPAFSWLGPLGAVPRAFDRWFLSGNAAQIAVKLLLLALVLLAGLPGAFRLRRWRRRRRVLRRAAAGGRQRSALPSQRSTVDTPDSAPIGSHFETSGAARRALAFTAWEELREYATDLGFGWQDSDTPRQLAGRLSAQAEFDEASAAAVGRVTTLVERAVYSPDPQIEADEARALPGDVSRVRGALAGAAGRAARLRAAVLPSSSIDQLLRRNKRHH